MKNLTEFVFGYPGAIVGDNQRRAGGGRIPPDFVPVGLK
jgi:hypothetical protein